MITRDVKPLLDFKADLYNRQEFIPDDPISIPHGFSRKEDIEIAGFLTAVIAWGVRKTIIANARTLMQLMDKSPYEFTMNASAQDKKALVKFVHRTFNGSDCQYFIESLRNIYHCHGGLERVFAGGSPVNATDVKKGLVRLKNMFFELPHLSRATKHLPDPAGGSAAKRMNMYLRWMVRKDDRGVDFGIWETVGMERLYCPLDVHSGYVARKLGLLTRKANDWRAVEELTGQLRLFSPADPVRYDFALFGMGMMENL